MFKMPVMPINPKYTTPITTLAQMLNERNIPYTCMQIWDGLQLRFSWCDGDIVCHSGSYGHSEAHVESYRFPWDDGDCTELTVSEAVDFLANYYAELGA